MDDLLREAAARAIRYRREVGNRPVWPRAGAVEALGRLDESLPAIRQDDAAVLALLDEIASPTTVATSGGRYFGFVTGSSLPATLAANWLASAWDQNAGSVIQSPAAARLEEVATQWMLDVLGLPDGCGAGFVTCATIANFSALAAARHALFARKGWDVDKHGLFGAPPITVVVGEEAHVSVAQSAWPARARTRSRGAGARVALRLAMLKLLGSLALAKLLGFGLVGALVIYALLSLLT